MKDTTIKLLISALESGKHVFVMGDYAHKDYEPTEYWMANGRVWVFNREIGKFAHPHIKTAVSAAIFIEKLCSTDCAFCVR